MAILQKIGENLAQYLSKPQTDKEEIATSDPTILESTLKAGDVLLVAGNSRISTAIKYLTQSSWSHAALFVGNSLLDVSDQVEDNPSVLIEADINEGVRAVPLEEYSNKHTRICRPVGLSDEEVHKICNFAISRLGQQYDLKNIIDLARYLFPTPLVPSHWRRRLLALGSGDPTRAMCSSLVAQAFQSVRYPILPILKEEKIQDPACKKCYREILQIRHHSLFTPRDFDVSPYFQIIKPAIVQGFDHKELKWQED